MYILKCLYVLCYNYVRRKPGCRSSQAIQNEPIICTQSFAHNYRDGTTLKNPIPRSMFSVSWSIINLYLRNKCTCITSLRIFKKSTRRPTLFQLNLTKMDNFKLLVFHFSGLFNTMLQCSAYDTSLWEILFTSYFIKTFLAKTGDHLSRGKTPTLAPGQYLRV